MLLRRKEIRRTRRENAGHLAGVLALLLMLTACGGGDDAPPAPSVPPGPGISITKPTSEPTFTDFCSLELVAGEAGFGTNLSCCTTVPEERAGVIVTWLNAATGDSGKAHQDVEFCLFSWCNHTWWALIPFVVGDNRITVTATDTATGGASKATLVINKPSVTYEISGTFLSHLGISPQINGSVTITRDGPGEGSKGSTTVSGSGDYTLGCVPDGTYILTPSSTFNYAFTPASRTVTVAGANVTGQNFTAPAFLISGMVTEASNGAPVSQNQSIALSGSLGSDLLASTFILPDGTYSFLVPNGTYTLTPYDVWDQFAEYLPARRTVTVNNTDVPSQDFLRR